MILGIRESNQKIVTDGLVLHLDAAQTLSYTSGSSTWFDLSGNGKNSTLTNGPAYTSSFGGSIVFDGTNDYVVTPSIDFTGTNKISLQFWCKLDSYPATVRVLMEIVKVGFNRWFESDSGAVITYADDSFAGTPIAVNLDGDVGFNVSTFSSTLVSDLGWHNWCAIYDKSLPNPETSLYIDGILRSSTSNTYTSNNTNNFGSVLLHIGGRTGGVLTSQANITNVSLYNRTLSASEVLQNYNVTKTRFGL